MSKIDNIIKYYRSLLKSHLTLVHTVQTGVLMGTADIITQTVIERKSVKEVNLFRTLQFFTLGVCLVGPSVSMWYKFLQRNIREDDKSGFLKKMAADQLIFAPGFLYIALTALNLIQGKSWEYTKREIEHKYMDILLTNYMIWPFVQTINFKFVHINYQVLFSQSVALLWNVYLSWKTQKKIEK